MSNHIQIFDTTLRDGEQTPGVSFSFEERIAIAQQLEDWGVDVIEAGFPVSSDGSFKSVQSIAQTLNKATVLGLARCRKPDIDAVYEATREAVSPSIHVFIATSPIHLEHKLKMSEDEVLDAIQEHVSYASTLFDTVQFSPEDATRTPLPFLIQCVQTAVDAGATVINIPDTVGYTYPTEYGHIFKSLIDRIRTDVPITYSAHCHDDLGLAVANSMAAIENGATRIEGTVNGIGERAGNTALEEVVLGLYVRQDHYNATTQINFEKTKHTSDLIARYSGIRVPRNKAIVGKNAFSHESGIHQDGFLKHRETYEIMTPQMVGVKGTELPLGKLSGKHAFQEKIKNLGYRIEEEDQKSLFKAFKSIADKKKIVTDRDIHALIQGTEHEQHAQYQLEALQLQFVSTGVQSAVVILKDKNNQVYQDSSIGTGSIIAIYNAVDRIFNIKPELCDYRIEALTEGIDAQAEVHIRLKLGETEVTGIGFDHDILYASCKAYVEASSKLVTSPLKKVGDTQ